MLASRRSKRKGNIIIIAPAVVICRLLSSSHASTLPEERHNDSRNPPQPSNDMMWQGGQSGRLHTTCYPSTAPAMVPWLRYVEYVLTNPRIARTQRSPATTHQIAPSFVRPDGTVITESFARIATHVFIGHPRTVEERSSNACSSFDTAPRAFGDGKE